MKKITQLAIAITSTTSQLFSGTISIRNEGKLAITIERVTTKSKRWIDFLDIWPTAEPRPFRNTPMPQEIVFRRTYKIKAGDAIKLEVADEDNDTWDHFNFG